VYDPTRRCSAETLPGLTFTSTFVATACDIERHSATDESATAHASAGHPGVFAMPRGVSL